MGGATHQKSEALFSPAECCFLGVLQQAVGNNSEVKRLIPRFLTTKDRRIKEPPPSEVPQKSENKGKVCPNFSFVMVKRVAKEGSHTGKAFWACSAFPK
jgi:hypothetical protein